MDWSAPFRWATPRQPRTSPISQSRPRQDVSRPSVLRRSPVDRPRVRGLPPSSVLGMVDVSYELPNGGTVTKTAPFVIAGFSPELSELAPSRVPINVEPTRKRNYWFTNKEH
jgi:hypothetical protein